MVKRRVLQPSLNTSIPDEKLVVTIESAKDLPIPGGKGASYIRAILAFPKDSPSEQRTPLSSELKPKAEDDKSVSFDSKLQFDVKRTKELVRYAERKRVRMTLEAHCETKVTVLHRPPSPGCS